MQPWQFNAAKTKLVALLIIIILILADYGLQNVIPIGLSSL